MELDIQRIDAETALVVVVGELDGRGAPRLMRELEHGEPRSARRLVIDLTDMTFMDSSGLATLLFAWTEVGRRSGELVIVLPVDANARRIFEVRGVAERLRVVPSRAEAFAPGPAAYDE